MSKSPAIGVVGPSHWAYMAKVMAEKLKEAVQKPCLARTDIPRGVLFDAVEFSKLVSKGVEPFASPDPPASLNTHTIALKVVERIIGRYPDQKDTELLYLGCGLIVYLAEVGRLCPKVLIVNFMAKFFSELAKMGEEERGDRGLTDGDDD